MRHVIAWLSALVLLLLAGPMLRAAEPAAAPASQVRFLDAAAARKVFASVQAGEKDTADNYFDHLMPLEMAAKTSAPMPSGTLEEQRAECRRRYQAAVLEFTPEEQSALRWYASGMDEGLAKDYPLLARLPWNLIKVSDKIEGDMSWTRGDCIVLSAGEVGMLVDAQSASRTKNTLAAGELLVHEHVHVLQRSQPTLFDSLYKEHWGFLHPDRIEGNAWLDEHQIVNPDAPDLRWVFPVRTGEKVRYIWPRVIFPDTKGAPRFPGDMKSVAVTVEPAGDGFRVVSGADGKPVLEDLDGVAEYARALAPSTYTIHPNEASADLFCALLIFDYFTPRQRISAEDVARTEKELAPYREWFRAHLK